MKVAIIGGGGAAHVLSVLLAGRGHDVRILTSKPQLWNRELELETADGVLRGRIAGASDSPSVVLGDAEVAILCMPVHQYPVALKRIMPVLARNRRCIVGTVYGQAGFDWMVKGAARELDTPVPEHFAIGLLPWIARTQEYGRRAISYGPKLRNGIATSSPDVFEFLQQNMLDDFSARYWGCGGFEKVPNFITLTLTVDNQIIHPSRCYALMNETSGWDGAEEVPYFYRDWDDASTEVLKGVDSDFTAIRKALFVRYPELANAYDLDYLALEHWSYGSHNPDIKASFVNSTTLGHIKPPVVRGVDNRLHLDVNHRFFKDDFAYGLEICNWVAEKLHCEVPSVKKLIRWYRERIQPLQGEIIESGVPSRYGLCLDDVMDCEESDNGINEIR